MFMLPVCIDDTPEATALVPDQFKAVHITRLPNGEPTPEFLHGVSRTCSRGAVHEPGRQRHA